MDRSSTQTVFRKLEVAPNHFGTAVHLVNEATVTSSDMPIMIEPVQRSEADSYYQCCAECDREQGIRGKLMPVEDADCHAARGAYPDYPLVSPSLLPICSGVLNKPHVRINDFVECDVKP